MRLSDRQLLRRLDRYILLHLENEKLNAAAIAGALYLSRSQLYRRVDALTGLSVNFYIREHRLRRAEAFLREGSLTIQEIAFACGFSSPKYFSRVFKDKHDVSPTTFRDRCDNSGG